MSICDHRIASHGETNKRQRSYGIVVSRDGSNMYLTASADLLRPINRSFGNVANGLLPLASNARCTNRNSFSTTLDETIAIQRTTPSARRLASTPTCALRLAHETHAGSLSYAWRYAPTRCLRRGNRRPRNRYTNALLSFGRREVDVPTPTCCAEGSEL